MKNIKSKKLAWTAKQDNRRKKKMFAGMASLMLVFFLTLSLGMYSEGSIKLSDLGKVGAPIGTATIMGAIGSIDRVTNSERTGKAIKDKLFILSADQVDESVSFPTRVGIELGNIPLKAGEYWSYIRAILDSIEAKSSGSEGDNASIITNEITFVVGGLPDKLIKMLENGIGEGFYVAWQKCATGDIWLGGNPCKPLKLVSFEGGSTKDFTGFTITFKNETGILWSKYTGNTPLQAASVVAADATAIPLTTSETYQLTGNEENSIIVTTFSGVTDSDVGRIVTVLGAASNSTYFPYMSAASGDFLLISGFQWHGFVGGSISFKIFKDGSGTYKFVEVAGSRI